MIASFFTGKGLKIALGALALVTIFASIQTVRIEGVWCSDVEAGEKPACIIRGFKQELQVVRIDLAEAEAYGRAEAAKHKATKQAYREAQEEAAIAEAARLARVVAEQKEITSEVEADYRQRIAALRARADRLRREAEADRGSGAVGAANKFEVSTSGYPSSGTYENADCNAVFAGYVAGEVAPLDDRIRCGEQAEKEAVAHEALIGWVKGQLALNPDRD